MAASKIEELQSLSELQELVAAAKEVAVEAKAEVKEVAVKAAEKVKKARAKKAK